MQTQPLHTQHKLYSTGSHWVHQTLHWVHKALRLATPNPKPQREWFHVAVEHRLNKYRYIWFIPFIGGVASSKGDHIYRGGSVHILRDLHSLLEWAKIITSHVIQESEERARYSTKEMWGYIRGHGHQCRLGSNLLTLSFILSA